MNKKKPDFVKTSLPYVILLLVILAALFFYNNATVEIHELTTGELMSKINEEKVNEITIMPKSSESVYYIEGKLNDYKTNEKFTSKVLSGDLNTIIEYASKHSLNLYDTKKDPGSSTILYVIVNVVPILILVVAAYFLFTKLAMSNNKSMDFGRSRAKLSENGGDIKFKDVAGLKEEKEEVAEIIDFLKNPKKFQKMGARIPKGVLLVGPPGTGKTLLAKAVAGEANCPFYFISGSDFVELFVGVGASRVRDMFKQAKQSAPCLIFIDEIDAVGRERGTGLGGGHDEREQILKVHAKDKTLGKDVNLEAVSKRTPGFSGADLENLLNEAALLTVRRDKDAITMDEIDEATDRVILGPAKTSRKITEKEKRLVAIHESGHAVIGIKLPDAEEVHKITIIPRGMAGGYTMMLPKEEHIGISTKEELESRITGLLGGRAAEELFLGQITTGASDDFKKATQIARSMVTEYGMSELGTMQFEQKSEGVFLGRDYNKSKNFSDQVALEIDKAERKIIDDCYSKAKKILTENKKLVHLLADALIENEILTKEQIESLVETGTFNPNDESTNNETTMLKLKEIAKAKGIKGYTKMTRDELESAIENADK